MKKILLILILLSVQTLGSEMVDKRKQKYQENKDHLRIIYKAIQSNEMDQVIDSAIAIEEFANKMVDYFPEGSESRGASDDIWLDFENFTKSAKANQTAAMNLRIAAQKNQNDELNNLFSELSNTCKSCHRSYKN